MWVRLERTMAAWGGRSRHILIVLGCTALVAMLCAASARASGPLGSSNVTSPSSTYYGVDLVNNPSQSITVSGTALDTSNQPFDGTVDLICTLVINGSTLDAPAASGVTVTNGSFSQSGITLASLQPNTCVMRAVPAGSVPAPAALANYTGPNLAIGSYSDSRISGSSTPANNGKLWNFQIQEQGFSGQMEGFGLLSAGEFAVSGMGNFTPAAPDFSPDLPVFHGNAWFNNSVDFAGTKSELIVDGKNAYPPAGAQSLYSGSPSAQDAAHFEALQVSGYSVDPTTGVMTLVETDPIMRCDTSTTSSPNTDPTPRGGSDPPSATNCPDFADTGVKLVRTVTYDHDGQQMALSDAYSSTDGATHTVNLRYFNGQQPPANYPNAGADAATQYQFNWAGADAAPKVYATGEAVAASPSGTQTIYIDPNGGNSTGTPANGNVHYDRGAVTFTSPGTHSTDGAQFFDGGAGSNDEYEFELNFLNRTVPATGSLTIGMVYSSSNTASGLDGLVTAAQNRLKATPTLTSIPSSGGAVGSSVTDVAHLSGTSSPDGSGSVSFKLYDNSTCTGTPLSVAGTAPATVTGDGDYTSGSTAPSPPGTYYWVATFSGDANNNSVSTACAAEPVTITKASPSLSTSASAGGAAGSAALTDTATLSGGVSPTGTIHFKLYGPSDSSCVAAAVATSDATVSAGNGDYVSSPAYTPTAAGTYHWTAAYDPGADANNNAVVETACSAEPVTITKASPSLSTSATAGVLLGGTVTDTATLSGGVSSPTGTIHFDLWGPNTPTCTGTPASSANATVSGNGPYTSSPPFQPTAGGTYHWTASYTGDANNNGVATTGCADPAEQVVVGAPAATVATDPASGLGQTQATLNATINPNGLDTRYHFFYGTAPGGENVSVPVPDADAGAGTTGRSVAFTVSGLSPGTTYFYRVVASSLGGSPTANEVHFTTIEPAPAVATGAASSITSTGATLNGLIDPNGVATAYHFDYGTAPGVYVSSVPVPDASAGAGTANVAAMATISGLTAGTKYYFRLVGHSSSGTTNGSESSFTAAAGSPTGGIPHAILVSGPRSILDSRTAKIVFRSSLPGVGTFECQLDNGPFVPCSSPFVLRGLHSGRHRITIRGVSARGQRDPHPLVIRFVLDVYGPGLTLGGKSLKVDSHGRLELEVGCSRREETDPCAITATISRGRSQLASGRIRVHRGNTRSLQLTLSSHGADLLQRSRHGHLAVTVMLVAFDRAHNKGVLTATRNLTLR